MRDELAAVLRHPALAPFLPLLHAAWEDGDLTADELAELYETIEQAPGITDEARQALHAWLDPARPPSAEDLARLARHIRRSLGDTVRSIPMAPADLGLELAGAVDPDVVDVLRRADRTLGPLSAATGERLLGPPTARLAPLPEPEPARFDPAALTALLDGPHAAVKAKVRDILRRPEFAYRWGISASEYREVVLRWARLLAAEGIGGWGIPTDYGGRGDPGGFIAAFTVLAHHDLSLLTKFGVQFGLFAGAIMQLGTEEHHRRYLPAAARLELPGCFAMTETAHGSDVAGLETTATYLPEADAFDVHTPHDLARKDYIGNAASHGRLAVVFARLIVDDADHGVHALLVPLRDEHGRPLPGVKIEDVGDKAGLQGVDNGRIWFDHVRVPRGNLLDRFGRVHPDGTYHSPIASPTRRFFTTLGTLVGGRVSVGAAAVAVAETALAIAVRYATRRRQFGTGRRAWVLADYRTHQRRLMPRLAATVTYHFALADLADDYVALHGLDEDTPNRRRLEARAAGLKAYATWHAVDTIQACREACGGQGYLAVNRLGPMRADADVFTTFEGDNTVLAQLVTKGLLTEYRSQFEDLTPGRLLRHLTARLGGAMAEAIPRLGAVGDVDEPESQLELLRRREAHVLDTLARRIRKRTDGGMDPAVAFLDVQPHVLAAARAHVERIALESVLRRERTVDDADLRALLGRVRSLTALWWIEGDLGWFLEHGVLSPPGAAEVRRQVTALSAELRLDARHITDAFAIPDEVLAAPIAL